MFSDSISDAYFKIYEGISNYNNYCQVQKTDTIKAMTHLNIVLYGFSYLCSDDKQKVYDRSLSIALFDYEKAINNLDFTTGRKWSDHKKFAQ